MADSEKKDIEDMMAVLAQMEEKEKYGNIGGREATGRVCKTPGKNPTSNLKSSGFQGSEPKVILDKSHAELSISAIHNRQILADKENCNFEIKSS